MTLRARYDGDAARRAILAVAIPGKLLPPQSAIAAQIGLDQPNVSYHLERLRDEWRIVTKEVRVWQEGSTWPKRRLLVLEVNP